MVQRGYSSAVRGQYSPYTTLGLRPGADRAAVDEAYRRLMKQHHPDLPGGDADFAAEINRAYAALKGQAPPPLLPAVLQNRRLLARRKKRRGRVPGLLMLGAAASVLLLLPMPAQQVRLPGVRQPDPGTARPSDLLMPDTFDLRSLPDEHAVITGVAAAQRLHRDRRSDEAVQFSRSCNDDLRTFPSPSLLDHCVAFDAASGLLSKDARFRAEDMAARHMGAAMRVSDDPVLAEERIASVRRTVEKMLVRREP